MRISDWSSDVCSSDLVFAISSASARLLRPKSKRTVLSANSTKCSYLQKKTPPPRTLKVAAHRSVSSSIALAPSERLPVRKTSDRKSGVSGKSVSVRVDLGGRLIIKKKKQHKQY